MLPKMQAFCTFIPAFNALWCLNSAQTRKKAGKLANQLLSNKSRTKSATAAG